MNKNAVQKFAVWARTELIAQVTQRAYQYGITAEGCESENAAAIGGRVLSADERRQRGELIAQVRQKGFPQVMEEVAYTWFNRFIALRFLEVNNCLPTHIRVFSDHTGAFKPEILSDVLHLELPGLNREKITEFIEKNQTDSLYRYLLLTQCNALNEALPKMFERIGSYTELLLPGNLLKADSVPGRMVSDIPEDDWKDQVQIIGWLYQYYNSELKDETFALLKKNVKITKERIPSATQLFTPDWIVRYMVENSLGRLWLEGHPDAALRAGWRYYLDEAAQEPEVQAQLEALRAEYRELRPQEIKVIDPCMGSGHILVYAFDVLMQIYESTGVSQRDAAQSILQNNLFGLDIDPRAAQLAYFAVMMKARQYDRRIFSRGIQPNLYSTAVDPELQKFGSLIMVNHIDETSQNEQLSLLDESNAYRRLLAQQYDVVCTNPPYRGTSDLVPEISEPIKKKFPDSKTDLFAAFIERCIAMTKERRYLAMVTQQAWMFLSSYEKLRAKLQAIDTVNLIHLGTRAFEEIPGEVVQPASFVLRKSHIKSYNSIYFRLVEPTTQQGKEDMFLAGKNCYVAQQDNFSKIPGSPIAYWVSEGLLNAFATGNSLGAVALARNGMKTGENSRFVRLWWEVTTQNLNLYASNWKEASSSGLKWFPYNKGGEFRKWYGNNDCIVNWQNEGDEIFNHAKADKRNVQDYPLELKFKPSVSWSLITSGQPAFRYKVCNLSDIAGMSFFTQEPELLLLLGFCNSKIALNILNILAPTINFQAGDIGRLPIVGYGDKEEAIHDLVVANIEKSTKDWDSFETSWDFKKHPLV